ncbi:MAG: VOC family protein [Chloroflexi bacterium]|nr:VOC family protein [Chloroflexota bacterium]
MGFIKAPAGKTVKRRLHLDIQPVRVMMEAEVQRLVELGASRVEIFDGPSGTWTVMADPARNEFCMTEPASIQGGVT